MKIATGTSFCILISTFLFLVCKHQTVWEYEQPGIIVFWYSSFLLLYEFTYEIELMHEVLQSLVLVNI